MLNKKHIVIFLGDEKHMNKNIKRIFFVATLLVLLFAIGTASASDVSDDTAITSDNIDTIVTTDADTTNTITNDNTVTDTATKDNNKNIEETDIEKQVDKNISDKTLENKKEEINENYENNIPTVNNEKNKNYLRSVKTSSVTDGIEYNEVDIDDEETFLKYFRYQEQGGLYLPVSTYITGNTRYKLGYFPENGKIIYFMSNMLGQYMQNHFSIVGKDGLTLNNVGFYIVGLRVSISNLNLNYNLQDENNPVQPVSCQYFGMPDGYIEFDNLNITVKAEYKANYGVFGIGKAQAYDNVIIQNSIINVEVPGSSYRVIDNSAPNTKILNNTISVKETYVAENPNIVAIMGTVNSSLNKNSTNITCIGNTITMNGKSSLTGIKLDGNTNTITNNTIIVYSPESSTTGVEINGNDNIVKNNKISANDKTGNDAVTVTGENNIVENNTASEADTRIPTSIELNYDGTPIDAGKRLVIRGTFKAGTVETYAEDIKVYDNNELIATTKTIDDFGTITYGYTQAIGGNHNITFKFNGNATHEGTSTSINVKVNGPEDTIIIREDNFYDYFNDRGELNYTKLSNNTTVYFESVPDEIEGITFDENRNAISNKTLTFVGLDGFTLTNKYVIMESTLKNFNLYNMTLVYTQEYMGSHLIISPKNENVEHYTVENVVIDLNYTDWDKENSIMPVKARGNNIVFENITLKGVVPADFINWNTGNGIRACIPIYVNGNNNLLSNIHVDLQAVNLADEFSSLYPSVAILGSNNLLTGSDIKINGTQYNYGITLTGENLTVTNNTFNITAERYSNAVVIISRSNHITIENNNINCSTTYYADGEVDKTSLNVGYCIYLEGQGYTGGKYWPGAGGINDTLIRNNSVVGSAFNIYGIEGFGNDNLTVVNNTFNLTAYYPMGIGVIGTYNNITDNIIIVKGESNNTGGSPDYIDPTTAGIILQYGENSTVYNNSISATNGSGILLRGDNRDSITSNNIVTTDYSYSIVLDGSSNNATVENNNLVTQGRVGDESVNNLGKENVVQNNLPVPEMEYFLKVDTTEFIPGTTASITASIYFGTEYTQDVATNISKGKISFKVNGKTLKDTNGKVIYAKVINGTATIENYLIPESWKEGSTIQAVYSGSTDLEKMSSEKTEITITATEPTITTEDITAQAGATITLKATINTDATINTGKVVFKINGKTLKDTNGKVIYTKVVNNEVTVEYTLPEEYTTGTYNITAVFISPDYERLEDTKTLTVTA